MAMASIEKWQSGKTLSQSARFMFDNQIATDVTFTFPNTDVTVKAHRFVLMARSPVFYVMFNSSLDKPGEDIEISDIDPDIFKEFLWYLYSEDTTLSVEKALLLTYCAEKYEVRDLKTECTNFLQTQVDETSVAMVLDHAILYNDDTLISTCKDIIAPLQTLSCLEEHHITKDALELVIGFEGLCVGEVDIFKFCNPWAENESKRMNLPVNASNRRKMLGPLLRKIPFCSMTHEQFANEVSGKHLLNGQEELQIFRFVCASDKSNPPFPSKSKKAPLKAEQQEAIDSDTKEVLAAVDSILNKLTPQNVQALGKEIQMLKLDNLAKLSGTAKHIFWKAIGNPSVSGRCAYLCRCLQSVHGCVDGKDTGFITLMVQWCRALIGECRYELTCQQKQSIIDKKERVLKEKGANGRLEAEIRQLTVEKIENETRLRWGMLYSIKFIGELINNGTITERIMHEMITDLLDKNDEVSLEKLCTLLFTIGKTLDSDQEKRVEIDGYFNKLKQLSRLKTTCFHIRIIIQQLIVLQMDKWVPRHEYRYLMNYYDELSKLLKPK